MTRKALLVGIDHYERRPLKSCVNDATALRKLLSKHASGAPRDNFDCELIVSSEKQRRPIDDRRILKAIQRLFKHRAEIALFYFSGHGTIRADESGSLVSQGAGDRRLVSMDRIIELANTSPANEAIVILDCCYSGAAGLKDDDGAPKPWAELAEGVSILAASREDEVAKAGRPYSLFTELLVDSLKGGSADIRGRVNLGYVYADVDAALGAWQQRPVFRTNCTHFSTLRRCRPALSEAALRRLTKYFPTPTYRFPVDSSFDPELPPRSRQNETIFADFRRYYRAGLLKPVGTEYLFHAAEQGKPCRLTRRGQSYWRLARAAKPD